MTPVYRSTVKWGNIMIIIVASLLTIYSIPDEPVTAYEPGLAKGVCRGVAPVLVRGNWPGDTRHRAKVYDASLHPRMWIEKLSAWRTGTLSWLAFGRISFAL